MRVHAITDVRVRAFIDVRVIFRYVRVHVVLSTEGRVRRPPWPVGSIGKGR